MKLDTYLLYIYILVGYSINIVDKFKIYTIV